jgi:peptidyl-prolyl cis-trans isomerase SurA
MKVNKLKAFLFLIGFVNAGLIEAQTSDPVLLEINNKKITKSDFLAIYNKNNPSQKKDKDDVKNYLELFINFKLKVAEAEANGLDTTQAFINELSGYRVQLSQPYMTDREVTESLLNEVYERMNLEVNASHILIKVSEGASAKDTLDAYKKVLNIKKRIDGGEKFEVAARSYSEDPSVKENAGDLGYFTAMQMVYPFENAAFNTPVGKVSDPVRTRYGYHLVYVKDKRKARGQLKVAHIMVRSAADMSPDQVKDAEAKINEIYAKVLAGEDFVDLAKKYSEDKGTAFKGGELPAFGTGRMVPEFEEASYALAKNGDYSKPIKTDFGWHIIKRLEKIDIEPFQDLKADLKVKVERDTRSNVSKKSFINKLKKEYNVTYNAKAKAEFVKLLNKDLFEGTWKPNGIEKIKGSLVTFAKDQTVSPKDLADFIDLTQTKQGVVPFADAYDLYLEKFLEDRILVYEKSQLENKYPDFKALMQEYRDGILLFEITDQRVWSKAIKDTTGFENFYNNNKNAFMWEKRLDVEIFSCVDEKTAKKLSKEISKSQKKGLDSRPIVDKYNVSSKLNVQFEKGKFAEGANPTLDQVEWKKGLSPIFNVDGRFVFAFVINVLEPEPKSIKEARGLITAKYQNHLEEEWIKELKSKYPVKVNQEVLNGIK